MLWRCKISNNSVGKISALNLRQNVVNELWKKRIPCRVSIRSDLVPQNSGILNRTVLAIRSDLICSDFIKPVLELVGQNFSRLNRSVLLIRSDLICLNFESSSLAYRTGQEHCIFQAHLCQIRSNWQRNTLLMVCLRILQL